MRKKVEHILNNKPVSSVLLLVASLVFIFILPLIDFEGNIVSFILLSTIILLAGYSISTKVTLFGIGAILVELITRATDFIYLNYLAEIISNLFFIYIVSHVIKGLLKRKIVDIYALIDAINGYLLLGLMFCSLVAFVDLYIPGSYNSTSESPMELVYYTMITLTTAGYGDITPQSPISQSLSMLIAVTGQFYVAVIVAILVGKFSSISNN
ncbi:potassium channel family protein [uncultured Algibacter sp.]|uniref:potassium channel family protein n=1 Tax=uncultured Algibacter sp. TaxID=298659 RepID=UPI002610D8D1|nr:potassium channel family protein [uncultured Algibacter sp.]